MDVKERDFARMSEDVEATIWRPRETIRVAELAATHRLGQMRCLLMHEKHKTWKRGFGFDRVLKRPLRWMKNALATVPAPFQTPSSVETWSFPDGRIARKNLHLK